MPEQLSKLKTTFKVGDTEYAVVRPSAKLLAEASCVFNRAFRRAVDSGAIIREKAEAILREQNLWDDARQAEADRLNGAIEDGVRALAGGGIKKSEARAIAVKVRSLRWDRRQLLRKRDALEAQTAEAQAENERFNFLAANCLVYNQTGEKVYKGVDDYLEHGADPAAFQGASHLAVMLWGGDDPDWQRKLPENQFLQKYGFVDDQLRLVNAEGKLVDTEGRLVHEEGRYVDAEGRLVDRSGRPIDADGNPVVEDPQPFFDD